MALDAGALPVALTNTVARTDFNDAMTLIGGSFPLQSADIDALQVTAAKLAADAVETAKIKDLNVTTGKIALLAITAALLNTDAVETAKIKDANVTHDKLATDAVETGNIKDANVTHDKLATDAVETDNIKDANVTAAKAEAGFGRYVPRRIASTDFNEGDLTTDGTWYADGLDVSSIVPAGAVAVHLRVRVTDDAANSMLFLRTNVTDAFNQLEVISQVANIRMEQNGILAVDSNRLIDYYASNLTFSSIEIAVVGWFI